MQASTRCIPMLSSPLVVQLLAVASLERKLHPLDASDACVASSPGPGHQTQIARLCGHACKLLQLTHHLLDPQQHLLEPH